MKLETTERGFAVIKFKDRSRVECTLQKSSIATEDCIWLGASKIGICEFVAGRKPEAWVDRTEFDESTMEHHYVANNRMHLTRSQVAELLPFLLKFVETGELND